MQSSKRPDLHIIMSFPSDGGQLLAQYVPAERRDRVKVFALDRPAVNNLRAHGFDASTLGDYVLIDSPDEAEAFESAYKSGLHVADALASVTYRDISVFPTIDSRFTSELVFLRMVLAAIVQVSADDYDDVIFTVPYYTDACLAFCEFAASQGFGTTSPWPLTVSNDRIMPLVERHHVAQEDRLATPPSRLEKMIATVGRQAHVATLRAVRPREKSVELAERLSLGSTALYKYLHSDLPALQATRRVGTIFYVMTNQTELFLRPLYPVIEEFRRNNLDIVVFTQDRLVVDRFTPLGLDVFYLPEIMTRPEQLHPHDALRYDDVVRQFVAYVDHLMDDDSPLRAAGQRDSTMELPLLRFLRNDWFYAKFYESLQMIDILSATLDALQPKSILMMPDCCTTSNLFAAVARSHGIPTVTTLGASLGRTFRSIGPYVADIMAADGYDTVEALELAWYVKTRPILTGAPQYDYIAKASLEQDREYVASVLDLDFSKRMILIATSRIDPNEAVWIKEFVDVANQRGDVEIVIKIHPLWTLVDYERVAVLCAGQRYHLVRDIQLYPLLHLADAVVTDYSHAGREALMWDKPLIQVNLTGGDFPTNRFAADGLALGIHSLDEIESAVARVLSDDTLRAALAAQRAKDMDRYNWKNDGKAAERMFQLLIAPPPLTAQPSQPPRALAVPASAS